MVMTHMYTIISWLVHCYLLISPSFLIIKQELGYIIYYISYLFKWACILHHDIAGYHYSVYTLFYCWQMFVGRMNCVACTYVVVLLFWNMYWSMQVYFTYADFKSDQFYLILFQNSVAKKQLFLFAKI